MLEINTINCPVEIGLLDGAFFLIQTLIKMIFCGFDSPEFLWASTDIEKPLLKRWGLSDDFSMVGESHIQEALKIFWA